MIKGEKMKFVHCDERRNLHARNPNISCGSYSFPADLSARSSIKVWFYQFEECLLIGQPEVLTWAKCSLKSGCPWGKK